MTIKEKCFNILSDLEFHCPCELPSSQSARIIKDLRNEGYEFYVNESNTIWAKNIYCEKCGMTKPHRKLLSLEKTGLTTDRVSFTPLIKERILNLYNKKDVFTGSVDRLEIDHRITPDRETEKPLPIEITDEELKSRYMVLSRVNNQTKREACKKCINSSIRQPSITGINFFYDGDCSYEGTCKGCFWAYPETWKKELHKKLEN